MRTSSNMSGVDFNMLIPPTLDNAHEELVVDLPDRRHVSWHRLDFWPDRLPTFRADATNMKIAAQNVFLGVLVG